MKKLTKNKKWIWIVLTAVVVIGGVTAALLLSRSGGEAVFVYGFGDGTAGMTDYYEGGSDSSGTINADRVQSVYLRDTQTVTDVLVSDGDQVKKGDVLFTYDTTLSDITLRQKELAVEQAKLDLETAKRELSVINSYVPISYHEVVESEPPEPIADLADFDLEGKDYLAYTGSGTTTMTPIFCWLRSTTMIDEYIMADMFAGTEEKTVFVLFRRTAEDAADGDVTEEHGLKIMRLGDADSYTYRFDFFNYNPNTGPVDDGIDWNSGYTASEIASMRAEKQAEIKEKEFNIKVAQAEYSIMQKEADAGEVKAEFDGTVMLLQDAEMALGSTDPFLKVSGGGGYYVEGQVSELELGKVQLGQKVTVRSWTNYMTYEGTVIEIQQFPSDRSYYSNVGSQNISYYPYKVFIEGSANLQDGDYVGMSLQASSEENNLYVNNAFVRTEGANSYVYARGENGKLEKRYIQTGQNLWGSYTEVVSGLTAEDYIAFPYGKAVKEGAPTQEGTSSDLYNY